MRGGSNSQGNFTFMQAIPSGLDHVLAWQVWISNSPLGRRGRPLRLAGSGPTGESTAGGWAI